MNGQNVRGLKNKEIAALIKSNTANLVIGVEDKTAKNKLKSKEEPSRIGEAVESVLLTPNAGADNRPKSQEFYENIESVKTEKPLDETTISQEPASVSSQSGKKLTGN